MARRKQYVPEKVVDADMEEDIDEYQSNYNQDSVHCSKDSPSRSLQNIKENTIPITENIIKMSIFPIELQGKY